MASQQQSPEYPSNPSRPERTSSPASSSLPAQEEEEEEARDHPSLARSTFAFARVAPLYLGRGRGSALAQSRLDALARRLRDVLVGDTVRGVQVGIEGASTGALGRTGALVDVSMRWIAVGAFLGRRRRWPHQGGDDGRPVSRDLGSEADRGGEDGEEGGELECEGRKALWIDLRYESARFAAVLVPRLSMSLTLPATGDGAAAASWTSWTNSGGGGVEARSAAGGGGGGGSSGAAAVDPSRFVHLPLLLLRMPAPLQSVVSDFLASTFDCKVSPLRLGTRTLVRVWEDWIWECSVPTAKDVVITLGFHVPGSDDADGADGGGGGVSGSDDHDGKAGSRLDLGIKSIEVTIPAADVGRFARAAEESTVAVLQPPRAPIDDVRKRRRLAGPSDEEGWYWRGGDGDGRRQHAFVDALALYLHTHLALDLYHPGVRIVRIACSEFVLSESRVKITAAARGAIPLGVWGFVENLVERADGGSGSDRDRETEAWAG